MKIGIDIDGTINNMCECILKVYNEDSGDNLKVEDITNYYRGRRNMRKVTKTKAVYHVMKTFSCTYKKCSNNSSGNCISSNTHMTCMGDCPIYKERRKRK